VNTVEVEGGVLGDGYVEGQLWRKWCGGRSLVLWRKVNCVVEVIVLRVRMNSVIGQGQFC